MKVNGSSETVHFERLGFSQGLVGRLDYGHGRVVGHDVEQYGEQGAGGVHPQGRPPQQPLQQPLFEIF